MTMPDAVVSKAYERMFRGRNLPEPREPVSEEKIEEASEALFAAPNPYKRGGAYDPHAQRDLREAHEKKEHKPVEDRDVLQAYNSMFA